MSSAVGAIAVSTVVGVGAFSRYMVHVIGALSAVGVVVGVGTILVAVRV